MVKIFRIDEIFPHVSRKGKMNFANNVVVSLGSLAKRRFKEMGTTCVVCGLEGTHFILEKEAGEQVLVLYGFNKGKKVPITIDHITPRAAGGTNAIANLQIMCGPCNHAKSDNYEQAESSPAARIQSWTIWRRSSNPKWTARLTEDPPTAKMTSYQDSMCEVSAISKHDALKKFMVIRYLSRWAIHSIPEGIYFE